MGLRNLQEKLEKSFYWWKKNIKDHSNTEFSQLCYYQMKWRNNKDFQTLAQNRRNIDSLGKLQDWTKHKWILLILSNLLIRSNTNSQTTILKFFWDQYESRISQIAEFSAVETKKGLFISSCIHSVNSRVLLGWQLMKRQLFIR